MSRSEDHINSILRDKYVIDSHTELAIKFLDDNYESLRLGYKLEKSPHSFPKYVYNILSKDYSKLDEKRLYKYLMFKYFKINLEKDDIIFSSYFHYCFLCRI